MPMRTENPWRQSPSRARCSSALRCTAKLRFAQGAPPLAAATGGCHSTSSAPATFNDSPYHSGVAAPVRSGGTCGGKQGTQAPMQSTARVPISFGRAPCYPGSILPRVAGACAHPMNAHDRPILSLVSGPGQFIIPPFQRPYRWSDEPCLVLLDDVEQAAAGSASGERHFLGSIVHYPRITEFGFTTSLLIDGQQRLTTPGRHLADRRSALNDIVGGSITIPALAGSGGAADRDRSRFAGAART